MKRKSDARKKKKLFSAVPECSGIFEFCGVFYQKIEIHSSNILDEFFAEILRSDRCKGMQIV